MSNKAKIADNQQERLNVKLNPDYIVGLADGEGYFSASATIDRSQGWNCHNVKLVFGIKLNAEDGKILYDIRDWFGCGNVSFHKDTRINFCDCLEFQIRDLKSLIEIVVPFFKKYPLKLPRKVKTFKKFVALVEMKQAKLHIGKRGFLRASKFAHQLHI
jgi:hypothetical protein